MSITVNTNMQALKIQQNLSSATDKMNVAMERMSSGYKINSAKDDAAGWAVATKLSTTISSASVAADNVQIGSNVLDTAEGTLDVVITNLQKIRDLAEQASNGTYSADDITAMKDEADALAAEANNVATNAKFNGITLFGGDAATNGITLQVGTEKADTLKLDSSIFKDATVTAMGLFTGGTGGTTFADMSAAFASSTTANQFLVNCDNAIKSISDRITKIGAESNQLASAASALDVQSSNLIAARSTIKDADVASESAAYVQAQILQSASATLLVQANAAPQIALTLIQG